MRSKIFDREFYKIPGKLIEDAKEFGLVMTPYYGEKRAYRTVRENWASPTEAKITVGIFAAFKYGIPALMFFG